MSEDLVYLVFLSSIDAKLAGIRIIFSVAFT